MGYGSLGAAAPIREAALAWRLDRRTQTLKGGVAAAALVDVGNRHLNLDAGLNRDGGDLLHNLRGRVQVDQALVDTHLEAVPRVGALTARGLADGQAQRLGGQTNRTLDLEFLVLSALDQIIADLLEVLDIAAGKRDADTVRLGLSLLNLLRLSRRSLLRAAADSPRKPLS